MHKAKLNIIFIALHPRNKQVADIEEKLDILIKAYMQDRERFLALPQVPDTQHSINTKNPPNPPPSGGGIMSTSATGAGSLMVKALLQQNSFISLCLSA